MTRETRRAQNEVWFRELNERLEARAVMRSGTDATFEIVCECALEECTERITIDATTYERVRAQPTHFLLVPGHEDLSVEQVVETAGVYEIVEKVGIGAVVAELEDPRG